MNSTPIESAGWRYEPLSSGSAPEAGVLTCERCGRRWLDYAPELTRVTKTHACQEVPYAR